MKQFTYDIEEQIAVLSTSPKNGWQKKLCRISWNGRPAKLDIREWHPQKNYSGVRMGKGITLTDDEARLLRDTINSLNLSSDDTA